MHKSCTLQFDGACKGNPGKGGAGSVLVDDASGDVVARVRKSMSYTTNNCAEYEGLNIGVSKALELGYDNIHAIGDSELVCKQVDGSWKVRSENLYEPYNRVMEQIRGLSSFKISHVPREYNTEADAESNRAFDDM